MIQVKYEEDIYEIRNRLDEITIEEFEFITHKLTTPAEDESVIDTWMDILISLNVDMVLLDNIDLDTFLPVIKSFDFVTFDKTIQKSILIDGVEYVCYDEVFRLKVKQLSKIEFMISNGFYLSRLLAYLYKRKDFTNQQNLEKAHIDYKVEFFKKQNSSLVMPILDNINNLLVKKLELL
jgi:hypothetical protein